MKVIIDLIEDVREEIGNQEDFILTAMLLKEDPEDAVKLIYAGETYINHYEIDRNNKQLIFKLDCSSSKITVGELLRSLLCLPMADMMYELRMDINTQYRAITVVGFGKCIEEKKFILFIKL